jgi:hypothetical protein
VALGGCCSGPVVVALRRAAHRTAPSATGVGDACRSAAELGLGAKTSSVHALVTVRARLRRDGRDDDGLLARGAPQ